MKKQNNLLKETSEKASNIKNTKTLNILIKSKTIEEKYDIYEHNLKIRSMSFIFIKKSILRIIIVWISIFSSSILVILSTMVPVALKNVKNGMVSEFGKYNSYSEYFNNTINVPVPKFNMQEQPNGDPSLGQVNSDWYGGTNPVNGGQGTDNRYGSFLADGSDMSQIGMNEDVFVKNPMVNFPILGYIGGVVISSLWINTVKMNPTFNTPAVTELVCNLLGVPEGDKSRKDGVSGCISYIVNQNAPSYIRAKLFGQSNPNFYLSFAKIAYNSYKDNLFTYIDGKPGNNIDNKIKLWGLENGNDYNIKDIKGQDLLRKLYEASPNYQNSDEFPVVVNLAAWNNLRLHHSLKFGDPKRGSIASFDYKVPIRVLEEKISDKWYVANANKFYYHLWNGESVFYQSNPSSTTANNFNGDSSGNNDWRDLVDYQDSSLGNRLRIVTLEKTVTLEIVGVADKQLGDAKIYSTHSAANEMSGYYNPGNNQIKGDIQTSDGQHYYYIKPAHALYSDTLDIGLEDNELKNLLNNPSTSGTFHIASDGHPSQKKLFNYSGGAGSSASPVNIGIIPGGYGLYGTQNQIYYNAKLSTNVSNDDLTNFTIFNAFGAYDRFGTSNGNITDSTKTLSGWNPSNVGGTPNWAPIKGDPNNILDNSSNKVSPSIYSLFSKELILDNIDRVIILVLSILYLVLAFLLVISLVIILVSSNIIIDDNKFNISTFKVLGYSDKDITRIILGIYNYIVALAFIFAVPVVIGLMFIITSKISSSLNGSISNFNSHLTDFFEIWQIPVAAIAIFLVFSINMIINRKILNNIKAIDVLKQ